MTIKDNNKQTILHCIARSGNIVLPKFVVDLWIKGIKHAALSGEAWDWRDRWLRTPVHWAVLNGHIETLRLLLKAGCSPHPPLSRHLNHRSSAENETPLQICERLYLLSTDPIQQELGKAILQLLNNNW